MDAEAVGIDDEIIAQEGIGFYPPKDLLARVSIHVSIAYGSINKSLVEA